MLDKIFIVVILFLFLFNLNFKVGGFYSLFLLAANSRGYESDTFLIDQTELYNSKLKSLEKIISLDAMPPVIIDGQVPEKKMPACEIPVKITNSENCALICNNNEAIKTEISKTENYIYNNRKLGPGIYCMLQDAYKCNKSTTNIIYTNNGWSCFNKFSEFGGSGGNRINVCNGEIFDNLTNTAYRTLPYNIVMNSPYETLPNSTRKRFECASKISQETKNYLIEAPWSHLELLESPCTEGITSAEQVKYEWGGKCECSAAGLYNFSNSKCTSCREGFGARGDFSYQHLSYSHALNCVDYTRAITNTEKLKYPPCLGQNCLPMYVPVTINGNPHPAYFSLGVAQ